MENTPLNTEDGTEEKTVVRKDRSLLYMGLILGIIILVMGYMTFFVDDPWKGLKKEEAVPVKVVEDENNSSILDESSHMSESEVRTSLVKFIEAFYYDQSRGYFDPPSYFANITETFFNFHNLTHTRLKEIYWKRREDTENLRRVWIVSSLKFERQNDRIIATYWTKETYFRPSLRQQYSGNIQYEMIIDGDGKIVSLRDIDVKDEIIQTIEPDSTDVLEPAASVEVSAPAVEVSAENKVYEASALDVKPEFTGGQKELIKYVSNNIKYPLAARQANIQGKVYISFVIDKDGSVKDAKVRQGIGAGCDEEALRIVKNSPKWKPGVLNGSPVRTNMVLPITFQVSQ
ncbi:energy transducer TonB [Desertivirga xinjiangensis]|uniref:energy transducer TonB n=1 Tax=Desertivirga xinjiangensis TaxID=539206 RepID=UPI00210C89F3|nr:energy transducer TonB [Pedobacter xinjiangensis]